MWEAGDQQGSLAVLMKSQGSDETPVPPSSLTPTANWPMSAPFPRAADVSSLAILVMKFLALLADWVCMAAQIALATRLVSLDGAADGLLIIPSRTL